MSTDENSDPNSVNENSVVSESQAASENKVYWASRRGMLELDLVLMPFAKETYPNLNESDQALYRHLLDQEDQDMFTWFLGHQEPPTDELKTIVKLVKDSR